MQPEAIFAVVWRFSPVRHSASPNWKPLQLHKGLTQITVRHCIKSDLPRGRFDWLKHGTAVSGAVFHAEEARSSAPTGQVHNTYLYLQSLGHLYLCAFHLCCFLSTHPRLCFSFMWADLPVVYILLFSCSFFRCSPCAKKDSGGINERGRWQRKGKGKILMGNFSKTFYCLIIIFFCILKKIKEIALENILL